MRRVEDGKEKGGGIYALVAKRIVSIEPAGFRGMLDLEIGAPHDFLVSGGVLSHNSHSVSYAMIGYANQFAKTKWPCEYAAALLNVEEKEDKRARYVVTFRTRRGVPFTVGNINDFAVDFTPDGKGGIRFGLKSAKNVSAKTMEVIVAGRPWPTITEFLLKSGIDRGVAKVVLDCGLLDDIPAWKGGPCGRRAAEAVCGAWCKTVVNKKLTFSDYFASNALGGMQFGTCPISELSFRERESLGVNIRYDSLAEHAKRLSSLKANAGDSEVDVVRVNKKIAPKGKKGGLLEVVSADGDPYRVWVNKKSWAAFAIQIEEGEVHVIWFKVNKDMRRLQKVIRFVA